MLHSRRRHPMVLRSTCWCLLRECNMCYSSCQKSIYRQLFRAVGHCFEKLDRGQGKKTGKESTFPLTHNDSIRSRVRQPSRTFGKDTLWPDPHPASATQAPHRFRLRHPLHRSRKQRRLHLYSASEFLPTFFKHLIVEVGHRVFGSGGGGKAPPQKQRNAERYVYF